MFYSWNINTVEATADVPTCQTGIHRPPPQLRAGDTSVHHLPLHPLKMAPDWSAFSGPSSYWLMSPPCTITVKISINIWRCPHSASVALHPLLSHFLPFTSSKELINCTQTVSRYGSQLGDKWQIGIIFTQHKFFTLLCVLYSPAKKKFFQDELTSDNVVLIYEENIPHRS